MLKLEENNKNKNEKKQNAKKEKYLIETIDIKEDTNITRIQSIIFKPNFFNQHVKQDEPT